MHTLHDTKLCPEIGKAEKWEANKDVFHSFQSY